MYSETRNNSNYGVITEQGDLGLGFNPISREEEKIIQENQEIQKSPKKDKDN